MELLLPPAGALPPLPLLRGCGAFAPVGAVSFKAAGSVLQARISPRSLSFGPASTRSATPPPSSLVSSISAAASSVVSASACSGWVVDVEKPPAEVGPSRAEVVDYYVEILARVLGDEKEAQACIYDASWGNQYRFRCDVDEQASGVLAGLSNVLSVRPDTDDKPVKESFFQSDKGSSKFSPSGGGSNHWLVRMRNPGVEVVTKAQIVDYYAETLAKILGNEKDAQASIYHISWEKDFAFCCQVDEECARELANVPEVLHVCQDVHIDSKNKEYGGDDTPQSSESLEMPVNEQSPTIKTKRLFVTGLSFYTSEKTLRAAFEGFGDLVEVKVIMDKISKRSKGYAFIEYATEEAAGVALKEMNGKIINGWMIVVDVAKSGPLRHGGGARRGFS
ncbi:unnamed protein product [Spirodela intermedia]|uniref:RRM domain-containing protein n=1 Tax=Spirodela intermedia TaxID=51605 RepID=A0A7I8KFJ0_SPIIN|nr:unnamed protein product [Spirodela intermedia]